MAPRSKRLFAKTATAVALTLASVARADVFVYECGVLPANSDWSIGQIYCDPLLYVAAGWFVQEVELCDGDAPPGGQQAAYTRTLTDFVGEPTFCVEWRVVTTAARTEIPWGGGVDLSLGSFGNTNYHFRIARDRAQLNRDNTLPIINIDIEPGVPHIYRLELYGATQYIWYIDGAIVDSGVPEGAYPSWTPVINWRARAAWEGNVTQWEFIRYGTIPLDASGDFDSNGDLDRFDYRYCLECYRGRGLPDDPGCRWAELDSDGDVDDADLSAFLDRYLQKAVAVRLFAP